MVQEKGSRERCSSWTALYTQCTSALSLGFLLSQGIAETLNRWGGKTKHRLISYFPSNTSAQNCHNRIVYVKSIASQSWTFLRHSVHTKSEVLYSFTHSKNTMRPQHLTVGRVTLTTPIWNVFTRKLITWYVQNSKTISKDMKEDPMRTGVIWGD